MLNQSREKASIKQASKKKGGRLWIGIVIGLLGSHLSLLAVAICLATMVQPGAIVPDYYEQSMDWDKTRDRQKASAELGWSCELEVGSQRDSLGRNPLRILLRDSHGDPIENAAVTVTAFHLARASDPIDLELKYQEEVGDYQVLSHFRHNGIWNFSVRVRARGEEFSWEQRQSLSNVGVRASWSP